MSDVVQVELIEELLKFCCIGKILSREKLKKRVKEDG